MYSAKYRKIRAGKEKACRSTESLSSDNETRPQKIAKLSSLRSAMVTEHRKSASLVDLSRSKNIQFTTRKSLRKGSFSIYLYLKWGFLVSAHLELELKTRKWPPVARRVFILCLLITGRKSLIWIKKILTVAQFLRNLDLGHLVPIFHQLHLRSERDLRMLSENIGDSVRREELRLLVQAKGLSIIDWWTIVKALWAWFSIVYWLHIGNVLRFLLQYLTSSISLLVNTGPLPPHDYLTHGAVRSTRPNLKSAWLYLFVQFFSS